MFDAHKERCIEMVDVEDIKWGKYRQYEGPYYLGTQKFKLPTHVTDPARQVAVVTATEGGTYDAYNGYDVCIASSGLIQMCEKGMFGVSSLLGAVVDERGRAALGGEFATVLDETGYAFRTTSATKYRFLHEGEVVDSLEEQQALFLKNSKGTKGTWDADSKEWAKRWAVAISSVWEDPENQAVQMRWIAKKLHRFCMPYAKKVLGALPLTPLSRAFIAAYYSYTANNPTWAVQSLKYAIEEQGADLNTTDGVIIALRELTFHKGITIYPHRYKKIRPVIEELYGVDLPDLASDLRNYVSMVGEGNTVPDDPVVWDIAQYQDALCRLGYDLGPKGVDGIWGGKTAAALLSFEEGYPGMPRDKIDGKPDYYAQEALEQAVLAL